MNERRFILTWDQILAINHGAYAHGFHEGCNSIPEIIGEMRAEKLKAIHDAQRFPLDHLDDLIAVFDAAKILLQNYHLDEQRGLAIANLDQAVTAMEKRP